MSSPAQQLPARANLEFLRKEARDLHHAFQAGDADAVERISDFLPRAGGLSTEDLADIKLSRQEAQHALACSYGFHKWDELSSPLSYPTYPPPPDSLRAPSRRRIGRIGWPESGSARQRPGQLDSPIGSTANLRLIARTALPSSPHNKYLTEEKHHDTCLI